MSHLRSRRYPLLTAERQPIDPASNVQNTRSLSTLAFLPLRTVRILCSPAAFRLCEEVGFVSGVHLLSGEVRSVTAALKVVEEVEEEVQEIKDE